MSSHDHHEYQMNPYGEDHPMEQYPDQQLSPASMASNYLSHSSRDPYSSSRSSLTYPTNSSSNGDGSVGGDALSRLASFEPLPSSSGSSKQKRSSEQPKQSKTKSNKAMTKKSASLPSNLQPAAAAVPAPDSTEASDTQEGNLRSRAALACERCRGKKSKCVKVPEDSHFVMMHDGQCLGCATAGVECVYGIAKDRAAFSRRIALENELELRCFQALHGATASQSQFPSGAIAPLHQFRGASDSPSGIREDSSGVADAQGDLEMTDHQSDYGLHDIHEHQDNVPDGLSSDFTSPTSVMSEEGGFPWKVTESYGFGEPVRWIGGGGIASFVEDFIKFSADDRGILRHPQTHLFKMVIEAVTVQPELNTSQNPIHWQFYPETQEYVLTGEGSFARTRIPLDTVPGGEDPSREDVDVALVKLQELGVHATFPIYNPQQLQGEVDAFFDIAELSGTTPNLHQEPVFGAFVFSLLATSDALRDEDDEKAGHLSDPVREDKLKRAWQYWKRSVDLVVQQDNIGRSNRAGMIRRIQTLFLLANFLAGFGHLRHGMDLTLELCAIVTNLGLNREDHLSGGLDGENERRLFWSVYNFDREFAMIVGRSFIIPESVIRVNLPLDIDSYVGSRLRDSFQTNRLTQPQRPSQQIQLGATVISGFIHLIRLHQLQTQIVEEFYDLDYSGELQNAVNCEQWYIKIEQYHQRLLGWSESLPESFSASPRKPIIALTAILQQAWLLVRTMLFRFLLPRGRVSIHITEPPPSFRLCADNSTTIINLATDVRLRLPHSLYLSGACYNLFTATLIQNLVEKHVVVTKVDSLLTRVRKSIERGSKQLEIMENYWAGSSTLNELCLEFRIASLDWEPPLIQLKKRSSRPVARGKRRSKPEEDRPQSSSSAVSSNLSWRGTSLSSIPPPSTSSRTSYDSSFSPLNTGFSNAPLPSPVEQKPTRPRSRTTASASSYNSSREGARRYPSMDTLAPQRDLNGSDNGPHIVFPAPPPQWPSYDNPFSQTIPPTDTSAGHISQHAPPAHTEIYSLHHQNHPHVPVSHVSNRQHIPADHYFTYIHQPEESQPQHSHTNNLNQNPFLYPQSMNQHGWFMNGEQHFNR